MVLYKKVVPLFVVITFFGKLQLGASEAGKNTMHLLGANTQLLSLVNATFPAGFSNGSHQHGKTACNPVSITFETIDANTNYSLWWISPAGKRTNKDLLTLYQDSTHRSCSGHSFLIEPEKKGSSPDGSSQSSFFFRAGGYQNYVVQTSEQGACYSSWDEETLHQHDSNLGRNEEDSNTWSLLSSIIQKCVADQRTPSPEEICALSDQMGEASAPPPSTPDRQTPAAAAPDGAAARAGRRGEPTALFHGAPEGAPAPPRCGDPRKLRAAHSALGHALLRPPAAAAGAAAAAAAAPPPVGPAGLHLWAAALAGDPAAQETLGLLAKVLGPDELLVAMQEAHTRSTGLTTVVEEEHGKFSEDDRKNISTPSGLMEADGNTSIPPFPQDASAFRDQLNVGLGCAAAAGQTGAAMAIGFQFLLQSKIAQHSNSKLGLLEEEEENKLQAEKHCEQAAKLYSKAAALRIASDDGPLSRTIIEVDHQNPKERWIPLDDDENEMVLMQDLASKGDAWAHFALGERRLFGERGHPPDPGAAREHFRRAGAQGLSVAKWRLGFLHWRGLGGARNFSRARDEHMLPACLDGLAEACSDYAYMISFGAPKGELQNYTKALEFYRIASENNDADAFNYIGSMYLLGKVVSKNESIAFSNFKAAARLGHRHALHQRAKMLHKGIGTPQSCEQAVLSWKLLLEKEEPLRVGLEDARRSFLDHNFLQSWMEYSFMGEKGFVMAQKNAAWLASTDAVSMMQSPHSYFKEEEYSTLDLVKISINGGTMITSPPFNLRGKSEYFWVLAAIQNDTNSMTEVAKVYLAKYSIEHYRHDPSCSCQHEDRGGPPVIGSLQPYPPKTLLSAAIGIIRPLMNFLPAVYRTTSGNKDYHHGENFVQKENQPTSSANQEETPPKDFHHHQNVPDNTSKQSCSLKNEKDAEYPPDSFPKMLKKEQVSTAIQQSSFAHNPNSITGMALQYHNAMTLHHSEARSRKTLTDTKQLFSFASTSSPIVAAMFPFLLPPAHDNSAHQEKEAASKQTHRPAEPAPPQEDLAPPAGGNPRPADHRGRRLPPPPPQPAALLAAGLGLLRAAGARGGVEALVLLAQLQAAGDRGAPEALRALLGTCRRRRRRRGRPGEEEWGCVKKPEEEAGACKAGGDGGAGSSCPLADKQKAPEVGSCEEEVASEVLGPPDFKQAWELLENAWRVSRVEQSPGESAAVVIAFLCLIIQFTLPRLVAAFRQLSDMLIAAEESGMILVTLIAAVLGLAVLLRHRRRNR